MPEQLKFPSGFLWGSATSSHQVEGGNINNWSEWEKINAERLAREAKEKWQPWQREKFPEMFWAGNYVSGKACDHYSRYDQDFDLARAGGHNAHRFSIEWSRIEPEEGRFDEKEIEHYRKVVQALRARGLEPFVTLWHWTHPLWLEQKGGTASPDFPRYFARYAKKMAENLGTSVKFWVTINEPMSIITNCYVKGVWPPQKKSFLLALKIYRNLAAAHRKGYEAIHEALSDAQVGFANIMAYFEPANEYSPFDRLAVRVADYWSNRRFLNLTKGKNDFLALQYYFHNRISFWSGRMNENNEVNDLGWEIYQEGIYHLLKSLAQHRLPIYITENGLADATDEKRERFIREGISQVKKALVEGMDIRGYFYWSLLDNFEWDKGFWPRFGLIAVDYRTLERKPRMSYYAYRNIIRENQN